MSRLSCNCHITEYHFLLSETAASGGAAGWFVKAQMRLLI
jgi:hypothetical protein